MRHPLEQRVLEAIRHSRMLSPGDRVAVAVSGGADSVALLRLLQGIHADLGVTLLVAHFNHCLRGAESDADAEFVAALAKAGGLELVSTREGVAAEAALHHWNVEDAARRLRYAFFAHIVEQGRAARVAVAHTADDQAETVLARIFRGTGLTGLSAIHPVVGPIVRPLLDSRRADLRVYLTSRGDTWREDSSNRDLRRQRARIREKLLPLIEREFAPSIVDRLTDLARLAREEETFWSALVDDCFRATVRSAPDDATPASSISVEALLHPLPAVASFKAGSAQPCTRALTERLIRRLYQELRGDRRQLTSRHVDQVIHLAAESSSGRRIELPAAITVARNFGSLVFSAAPPADSPALRPTDRLARRYPHKFQSETAASKKTYSYTVDLDLPSSGSAASVSVTELGCRFRLKVIDWPMTTRETESCGEALDADLLRAPLILRNWRPGDSYRPRGRRQPRKLKQMFLAARIPSRARSTWPVLESGGRVVWARGMPPAHEVSVTRNTRAGVVIEERAEEPRESRLHSEK